MCICRYTTGNSTFMNLCRAPLKRRVGRAEAGGREEHTFHAGIICQEPNFYVQLNALIRKVPREAENKTLRLKWKKKDGGE